MTKEPPEGIPAEVWAAAMSVAPDGAGRPMQMAFAEVASRAILAERGRVMGLLDASAPHSPRRYIYDDKPERRIWACERLEESISRPA